MNKIATFFFGSLSLLFFSFALCLGSLLALMYHHAIDFSALERSKVGTYSILLDDEGNEWARFALDKRQPIEYRQIPPHVIHAFCAAEDWHFFEHAGLSYRGIIRSLLVNLYYGKKVQGASTITQQLVKLIFFDNRKTFSRKLKEQLYAVLVEQQYTKEHILHLYLNNVCFGSGIYGIEAAAQRFWGISACDLTIDQAALLAGVIRRPEYYCPLHSPLTAQRRRNVVLQSMLKCSSINQEQYEQARAVLVVMSERATDQYGLYLKEMIRLDLEAVYGKTALYTGGLVIQTTLRSAVQKEAEKALYDQCMTLQQKMAIPINGALISMSPSTGEIKALVGGFDFMQSQFNRATQALRQLGSVIKPLIYTAAVAQGYSFAHTEIDEPYDFVQHGKSWTPQNYDKKFLGPMTLALALSRSNNIVAIKMLLNVGADAVVNLLEQCQVTSVLHNYPSLALGCIDTTLLEAVGMFNVFANNGMYVKPHYIRWVKDALGEKKMIYKASSHRVVPARASGQVTKVLSHSLQRIRSITRGGWIDADSISKTGTTNDSRTCWFVGATPELTTGVYVGCDDNRTMGTNVYPIKTAFPIWLALYRSLTHQVKEFVYDPSLREVVIDAYSGQPSRAGAPHSCTIMR
jgi:penicillin-binding protein 1A